MAGLYDKVDLFDAGAKLANTDLLAVDIVPTLTKSILRIQAGFSANTRFGIVIKQTGAVTRRIWFEGGQVIASESGGTYVWGVRKGKSYNFQVDSNVDLWVLQVEEVEGPVV